MEADLVAAVAVGRAADVADSAGVVADFVETAAGMVQVKGLMGNQNPAEEYSLEGERWL